MANRDRALVIASARVLRTSTRTVAELRVIALVEHADPRQTALDFGGEARPSRPATRSGVHVIDCDALDALEADGLEIGGAA